jgi:hypothetical protein
VKRDHDKIATEALLIGLSVTTSIRNEIRAIPREALSAKLSKPKRFFLQSIKKTFFCIVTGKKHFYMCCALGHGAKGHPQISP